MTKIAIFDLDNCLSDDAWRVPLINWLETDMVRRYYAYHDQCHRDIPENRDMVARWSSKVDKVAFLTSRPVAVQEKTVSWIKTHIVPHLAFPDNWLLKMRHNNELDGSVVVKRRQLNELILDEDDQAFVAVAFDDRDDILEMYRAAGVKNVHKLAIRESDVKTESDPINQVSLDASDYLDRAAETFRERNATYGSGYQRFGALLTALLPEDGLPPLKTPRELARLNFVIMCLAKLQRYANHLGRGGHGDSARDLQVYASMLEEHTEKDSK